MPVGLAAPEPGFSCLPGAHWPRGRREALGVRKPGPGRPRQKAGGIGPLPASAWLAFGRVWCDNSSEVECIVRLLDSRNGSSGPFHHGGGRAFKITVSHASAPRAQDAAL